MASVDDLFRKPNALPKRKLEDPTTSFSRASNKSAKLANGSSPRSSGAATSKAPSSSAGAPDRAASVRDEADSADSPTDDDIEAGPAPPPVEDEDGPDDDEDGRFFGSGVTAQEREVLNYIDRNEDGEAEKIDLQWLKRTMIGFERKINKNAELRAKYVDDPMKFVSSEADLDAEIKGLSMLSEHGELYNDFIKSGSVGSLVDLLSHENTDIAIAVCEVLEELTDEDTNTTDEQWKVLVDAMIEHDLIDLLVSNLSRLDEDANENDRNGVYHILSVVENLLSQPSNLETVGSKDRMLQWLISRIKKPDPNARGKVGQNRHYAAELLAILLQGNLKNRDRFAAQDGVDVLLEILSAYRKCDPEKDSDEEEFVENAFDGLSCLVEVTVPAENFLEGEGVELCLIMLREGKLSKSRALKVLDHAMNGASASAVCDRVIDAAGLKTLFGLLMKATKKGKLERESVEHIIGITAGLLRYTPANSASRIRTLAKFVEKEYEKIGLLVDLRTEYSARVSKVDAEKTAERQGLEGDVNEQEDQWLSRRLDAGLFSLQSLDVILSWLVAEDRGARKRVTELLGDLDSLSRGLQEQLSGIDVDSAKARETKEMLEALVRCL
jgi:beta-catenin-like protein 1